LSIVDNIAQVSDIVFPDFDLDETDLGGVLEWREPADVAQVTHYDVYMIEVFEPGNCTFRNGSSMDGSCDRLAMGSSMVGVANLTIPVDTALQNYSHFAVFTRSSLVEQTTPSMHLIYDMVASVSNIRFTDQDLDDEELGGRIHWAHPPLMQRVYTYRLYLTQWDGGARSLISELPKGVNLEDLPPETPTMPLLAIYTTSTLTEQSTPVTLTVEDKFAPVSNVSFPDFDLDETDLGGILTWSPPQDESQVERYMIYMAMFTQNASECPMSSDGASYVAVITGSMVIALSGATASQVADAVQASLSQLLGVPFSWISVSASAARRLRSTAARRLSTTWNVQYQIVVPVGSEAAVVTSASTLGSSLGNSLAAELVLQGVSGADVASLSVLSVSPSCCRRPCHL